MMRQFFGFNNPQDMVLVVYRDVLQKLQESGVTIDLIINAYDLMGNYPVLKSPLADDLKQIMNNLDSAERGLSRLAFVCDIYLRRYKRWRYKNPDNRIYSNELPLLAEIDRLYRDYVEAPARESKRQRNNQKVIRNKQGFYDAWRIRREKEKENSGPCRLKTIRYELSKLGFDVSVPTLSR